MVKLFYERNFQPIKKWFWEVSKCFGFFFLKRPFTNCFVTKRSIVNTIPSGRRNTSNTPQTHRPPTPYLAFIKPESLKIPLKSNFLGYYILLYKVFLPTDSHTSQQSLPRQTPDSLFLYSTGISHLRWHERPYPRLE